MLPDMTTDDTSAVGRTDTSPTAAATIPRRASLPPIVGLCLIGYVLVAALLATIGHATRLLPTVTLLGRPIVLSEAHDFFFRYSVMGLVFVPAIFLFEIRSVGWHRSSLRELLIERPATGRTDFVCFILAHLRLTRWPQILLTFGFALLTGEWFRDSVAQHTGLSPSLDWIPLPLRFPSYLLLYSFFDYVAHRLDHSPLLWPLHRYHHAAEEFYVLTAVRGHPATTLTQLGIKTFPLALLGVPTTAIIDVNMFVIGVNYLIHSRIESDFGWIGQWILLSPPYHRLHHKREFTGEACNYSICPLWDRLFGTWERLPEGPIPVGIEHPYRHGAWIVTDLRRDYVEFLAGLWRFIKPR
jgi:sterol desaturase/sphingolipid hydroxylase (fatty acid hydroxylase superfamily)